MTASHNREIARKAKAALAYYKVNPRYYKEFSDGCFGSVHEVPECQDVVIKVSRFESDNWRKYIKWAMQSKSRHAPRVYGLLEEGDIFAVAMERLEPIHDYYNGDRGSESVRRLRRSKHYCWALSNYGYGSLKAFVGRIDRFRNEVGGLSDLHKGNIMRRADDTLVVTDPMS